MKKTKQTIKEESKTNQKYICTSCNENVQKLYQDNLCKPCLVKLFKKLTPLIDHYRNSYKN